MAEFYTIERLAITNSPQQLEMLGIFVPSWAADSLPTAPASGATVASGRPFLCEPGRAHLLELPSEAGKAGRDSRRSSMARLEGSRSSGSRRSCARHGWRATPPRRLLVHGGMAGGTTLLRRLLRCVIRMPGGVSVWGGQSPPDTQFRLEMLAAPTMRGNRRCALLRWIRIITGT